MQEELGEKPARYQRPPLQANEWAQTAPRSARQPQSGRRQASARQPASSRGGPRGDARTRGSSAAAASSQHAHGGPRVAVPTNFPGLEGDNDPTPIGVTTASAAQAVTWLKDYGEAHVELAEATLPRIAAHCQGQNGVAAPNDVEVVSNGGVKTVVKAMRAHGGSERVQAFGCMIIGLICDRDARLKDAVREGAVAAVVAAVKAHKTNDVMTSGCLALGQLATLPDAASEASAIGAINLVVASMRSEGALGKGRSALQANGCMALSNLIIGEGRASDAERCGLAVDIGALNVVVDALVRFPAHDGVLHWGTTAVLRLTHESPERAQLALAAGTKDALHLAFSQPQTQNFPTIAAKVELAHKWLAMHEKVAERGGGGAGGDKPMSKAERVYKDLLFEHATGEAEIAADIALVM